jgi:hypothetical protein
LTDSVPLITCTSLPVLLDSAAIITFQVQLSGTADFSVTKNLASSFNGIAGSDVKVGYQSLNDSVKAILYSPDPRTVYVRLLAYVIKGTTKTMVSSQVMNFQVTPYVMFAYNEIMPKPYYIIGLGDGTWNNSVAGIGVSIFPLSIVPGNVYHSDGSGEYSFTGYFLASNGFKLIRDIGSWSEQWGMSGSVYAHNDSGSGNITVPTDGYYTIDLNSINNTLTIVPATAPTTNYTDMALSGDLNGWSATANPMSGFFTTNNHQWYATVTITSSGGIKFNNNNWANSWGATAFPNGFGTNGGPNIPITAGTYTVLFNDIDDCYYFIKQ